MQGDKVRVVSEVIPGVWNKPREMVLTYVAEDTFDYTFSARPLAGTQVMPKRHVASIEVVAPDTKIMLPRIKR